MQIVSDTERKYLITVAVFLFVWFLFVIPRFSNEDSPYTNFIVFNLLLWFICFIVIRTFTTNRSIQIEGGFVGVIVALFGMLVSPPYNVNPDGVLTNGSFLSTAAFDYLVGHIWQNTANIPQSMLYAFTYPITGTLMVLLIVLLGKDLIRRMS